MPSDIYQETAEKIWGADWWREERNLGECYERFTRLSADILRTQFGPMVEANRVAHHFITEIFKLPSDTLYDWTPMIRFAKTMGRWHDNGDSTGTITERKE